MDVAADAKVAATVKLAVGDHELTIDMRLPARPTRPGELLPLYRGLAEHIIQAAVNDANDAGRVVSCRKGCCACCCQLIPISELEARRLREVVDEMPAARRAVILQRFSAARGRLAETGLLPLLRDRSLIRSSEAAGFGLRYLAVGMPCPFLEEEACSIYEERPIICREYLVTSPPADCDHPTPGTISPVKISGSVCRAIRWLTAAEGAEHSPWVPLVLALEWAEDHPEPAPTRIGAELVRELLERLSARPPAAGGAA
jgi:Fe-S-cluster containining protein